MNLLSGGIMANCLIPVQLLPDAPSTAVTAGSGNTRKNLVFIDFVLIREMHWYLLMAEQTDFMIWYRRLTATNGSCLGNLHKSLKE